MRRPTTAAISIALAVWEATALATGRIPTVTLLAAHPLGRVVVALWLIDVAHHLDATREEGESVWRALGPWRIVSSRPIFAQHPR